MRTMLISSNIQHIIHCNRRCSDLFF